MSRDYLNLTSTPHLDHPGPPLCGACCIEVELEDDWLCPSCGTTWPSDSLEDDGSRATLYADWSGEKPTGATVSVDMAWNLSYLDRRKDQEAQLEYLRMWEAAK